MCIMRTYLVGDLKKRSLSVFPASNVYSQSPWNVIAFTSTSSVFLVTLPVGRRFAILPPVRLDTHRLTFSRPRFGLLKTWRPMLLKPPPTFYIIRLGMFPSFLLATEHFQKQSAAWAFHSKQHSMFPISVQLN